MEQKHGYSQRVAAAIEKSDANGPGRQLARLCLKRGYTVSEVAEVMKVSRQTVYNWFSGRLRPRPKHQAQIQALIEKLQAHDE